MILHLQDGTRYEGVRMIRKDPCGGATVFFVAPNRIPVNIRWDWVNEIIDPSAGSNPAGGDNASVPGGSGAGLYYPPDISNIRQPAPTRK